MKNVHCQSKNAPMMYLNSCCLIFSLGYQNNISCSYDNCLILISLQMRYFTTQAQKSREKGESRNSSILTSILTSSSMIKRRRKNSSILAKSKLFFCFFLFSLKALGNGLIHPEMQRKNFTFVWGWYHLLRVANFN